MTAVYHKSRRGLDNIDEDLSAEGLSIMLSEPPRMVRNGIGLLFSLLLVALAWSFYGKAPVIVAAQGTITPESEQQRVYVPIKGELIELYVAEGQPVRAGDTLARLNSADAVRLVGQAEVAQLALQNAQRAFEDFPLKQEAMNIKLALFEEQIRAGEKDYEKMKEEGLAIVGEEQRLKLVKARENLSNAIATRNRAREEFESFQRLNQREDGGGISADQVAGKSKDFAESVRQVRVAEADLGEFEINLGQEYARHRENLQKKLEFVLSIRQQRQDQLITIQEEEFRVRQELNKARHEAEVAQRLRFSDIDENNFLRIRAPIDGVVAEVTQTQVGAQVQEQTPLITLAPMDARKVLEITILEKDVAFVELGMPVKIKMNAFSYQKHGFINGTLEYLAEVAFVDQDSKQFIYKARVGLERDFFTVDDTVRPIRYGMGGIAEVMVRQRRLIDIALDPIRKITAG